MNRLAIFDVDGTLCDTSSVDDECFCATASKALAIRIPATSWEESPHITDLGIVEWLWKRYARRLPTRQEVESFVTNFETALGAELQRAPERFAAVTGAVRLIPWLETNGWRVAFATGGWGKTARLKLRAAGFPIGLLFASSDDSHDRSAIFGLARARATADWGESLDRTVLVGDGTWDVRVASSLRWPLVGVGRNHREAQLRAEGATIVIPDFADREAVLEALLRCERPSTADAPGLGAADAG